MWLLFATIADCIGLLLNFATLVYTFLHFDLKVHVFCLVFIDTVLSTLGSLTAAILDILLLSGYIELDYIRDQFDNFLV